LLSYVYCPVQIAAHHTAKTPECQTGSDPYENDIMECNPSWTRDQERPGRWYRLTARSGPVVFDRVNSADTFATFPRVGDYLLRLTADDVHPPRLEGPLAATQVGSGRWPAHHRHLPV